MENFNFCAVSGSEEDKKNFMTLIKSHGNIFELHCNRLLDAIKI